MSDVSESSADIIRKYDLEESQPDFERELGFWVYLMSDAVVFALLLATYAVMVHNTADGPTGADLFSLSRALSETGLLLVSSLTFGFATLASQARDNRATLIWLGVTFLLGAGFLGLEIGEFSDMIAQGAGPDRSGFLSAFFLLVGTHGLHVFVGLLWIVVLAAQILVKGLSDPTRSRLRRLGMFWHFLDVVWVGVFSLVYLGGLA